MNVFTFTGNLGKECRTANNGTAVCNFAVAVKSGFGDNATTLWVDCALWGKQAESKLVNYLVKGQQVAISGELGMREHDGKSYLTCRVSSISLIGGTNAAAKPAQAQQPAQQQGQGYQQPAQQGQGYQQRQTAPQQRQQQNQAAMAEPDFDFDDDIPF
jgi:single-strand DNA-binding protein